MQFVKKVAILKQISSIGENANKSVGGIARIELTDDSSELYLSLINFRPTPSGNYHAFLLDGKGEVLEFNLGSTARSLITTLSPTPFLDEGFAIFVSLEEKSDQPSAPAQLITLSYGRSEDFSPTLSEAKATLYNWWNNIKKADEVAPTDQPFDQFSDAPTKEPIEQPTERTNAYDDEAVATVNYFEFDEKETNLDEEQEDGALRLENELSFIASQEEEEQGTKGASRYEDETDLSSSEKGKARYFKSVERDLERLFNEFERECSLDDIFPDGKFVKVQYLGQKYYIVGLIKEEGVQKYICYGVPGVYSERPPKALEGYCAFIPLSPFNLCGDGFWMLFQDADSGECIKLPKN